MNYEFTTDWFSSNVPNWTKLFDEHIGRSPRILEVGSFEGRSTCWMIERLSLRHGGGEIYCVDPWIGNDYVTKGTDMSHAELLFNKNVGLAQERFPDVTLHQMKEFSVNAMSLLMLEHSSSFDLVYVDGDHTAKAALTDLVLSHQLCKDDGIIIVDDYLWNYEGSVLTSPKPGVDAYTTIFADEVYQLPSYPVYQVFLKKRKAG
jgi:predicted O-methyltransferase YrrM